MWTDRRWVTLGLGASLILNVFFAGLISGHVFSRRDSAKGPTAAPGALVPQHHVRALPTEERKLFAAGMAPHREAIKAARQALQTLRQTAEADIAAQTFDRDKVAADLKALRDGQTTMLTETHAALVEALEKLSPASRTALVAHEDAAPR